MDRPESLILSIDNLDLWANYLLNLRNKTRCYLFNNPENQVRELDRIAENIQNLYSELYNQNEDDLFGILITKIQEIEADDITYFLYRDATEIINNDRSIVIENWMKLCDNLSRIIQLSNNKFAAFTYREDLVKKVRRSCFTSQIKNQNNAYPVIASAESINLGLLVKSNKFEPFNQTLSFTWHSAITLDIRNKILDPVAVLINDPLISEREDSFKISYSKWINILMMMTTFFKIDYLNYFGSKELSSSIVVYKNLTFVN